MGVGRAGESFPKAVKSKQRKEGFIEMSWVQKSRHENRTRRFLPSAVGVMVGSSCFRCFFSVLKSSIYFASWFLLLPSAP